MADNQPPFAEDNPPEFSDEAIRRFLLGSLDVAEQTAFEERLFANEALEARVRYVEFELTDDYAFERLSTNDRELFEQKFLNTSARKQKLLLSTALRERFGAASGVAQTVSLRSQPSRSIGEKLRHLLASKQPAWRLAFGLVVLSVLAGTIWMIARKPRIREQLITTGKKLIPRRRPAPATAPPTNQQEAHHVVKTSPTPLAQETAPPRVIVEGVVLSPQGTYDRNSIRIVKLPEVKPDVLRLQLALETDHSATSRAEVLTISGQSVFVEQSLRVGPTGDSIEFDVPMRLVNPGDYQVKLIRVIDGIEAGVTTYYFRLE